MNRDIIKTFVNKIVNISVLKEILTIIPPGLWMLLMGSNSDRWNNGPLIIFGSILIICGYKLFMKERDEKITLWFSLYIGMFYWSIFVFISWVLSDRGTLALLSHVKKIVPITIQQIFWLFTSGGILYFTWHAFSLKSKGVWIYLGLHLGILIFTIWYFYSTDIYGECIGVDGLLTGFACSFIATFGSCGIIAMAIILLLLPTILALRYKQSLGNISVILVLAIVPAWIELFFFPLQAIGKPILDSVRELSVTPHFWSNMRGILDKGSYTIIFSFMLFIPIGMRMIRSERLKAVWALVITFLTLTLFVVFYVYGTQTLREVQPILDIYYLLFSVFLGHIILSTIVVISWKSCTVS